MSDDLVDTIRELEEEVDPNDEIRDPRLPRPPRSRWGPRVFVGGLIAFVSAWAILSGLGWRVTSPADAEVISLVRRLIPGADEVVPREAALRAAKQMNFVAIFSSLIASSPEKTPENMAAFQRLVNAPPSFDERKVVILDGLLATMSRYNQEDANRLLNRILAVADVLLRDPRAFDAVDAIAAMPTQARAELFATEGARLKQFTQLWDQVESSRKSYQDVIAALQITSTNTEKAERLGREQLGALQAEYNRHLAAIQQYSDASRFLQNCARQAWATQQGRKQ